MSFSFGQKPNEPPTFGQASFGTPQFGSPASTTAQSQFSSPFGAKPAVGGFQFSTPTTAPSFGGSYNFTATTQQNANPSTGSFGFNTTTAPAFSLSSTASGHLFSSTSTAPQTTSLFGTTTPSSGFAMGATKTTASTFAAPAGGLFGTTAPTASATQPSGFGMSATMPVSSGLSFGASQAPAPKMTFGSSTAGGYSFGSTATTAVPTTGFSLGAVTSSASTPKFSLGPATTSTVPNLNFNSIQSTPTTTLSFQPTSTAVPQTGLSFATSSSTAPQTSLTFGAPATTAPNIGLSFGTTPTSTATTAINFSAPPPTFGTSTAPPTGLTFSSVSSTPTTTLNFMTPASTATSLGLGVPATSTPATTAGLSFLATTSAAPATSIGFGGTTLAPASTAPTLSFGGTTAPSTTINFGAAITTTSAPTLNFGSSLATTTPASTSGTTTFGLGGIKPTTTTSTITGFGLPSHTLGGVPKSTDANAIKQGTDQTEVAPKDQVLPNELMQTVEGFKKFVKEQKGYSSEIGRFSIKDLRKVENDVDVINNCMNEVQNQLRKNKAIADKLKMDTARDLQHAEMAQRTFDTPVGLQYENTAPFNYFVELCDNFETEMHDLKIHIENVAKYIRNSGAPTTLSPEDLALGMRRLHESFVALAGRLQSVHSQVELQKEQYLNLRKKMLNDYTNVFEKQNKESDALEVLLEKLVKQQPNISNSPTPFTSLRSSQVQAVGQNNATIGNPIVTTSTLGPPVTTGFNIGGTPNMSLFGSSTTSAPSLFNTTPNSFQLQKPPVGNKRGKP